MRDALFDLCRRFADAHVDSSGWCYPGSRYYSGAGPASGDLQAAIAEPLVAMLLEGVRA